jgi:hypothetical protein
MRAWLIIRQLVKDLYWAVVAIVALFILLMVARDIYYNAYPGQKKPRKVPVYGGQLIHQEVEQWFQH